MKLFLIILLSLAIFQSDSPRLFEGRDFIGYIFGKDDGVYITVPDQKNRYTPKEQDIVKAENIIQKKLQNLNERMGRVNQVGSCPVIHKKLHKYNRQYVGFVNNKDERIIWINFLWDDAFVKDLSKDIVVVNDGCSNYWQIKVNIDSEELFDLEINGLG